LARVHDLEQARIERLADELVPALAHSGDQIVTARLDDPGERDLWRRAARRAGRQLGLRTRTGVSWVDGTVVWAYVEHIERRARLVPLP
jgi:hypothetical protein